MRVREEKIMVLQFPVHERGDMVEVVVVGGVKASGSFKAK